MRKGRKIVQAAVQRLKSLGLNEEEMRRLVENELTALQEKTRSGDSNE